MILCGFEKVRYEIQKRGGNASSPLIIFEICAIVLGRYAVLFSTAPPPFRLSALQNACVCPHSGRHIDCIFSPYNDKWEPLGFPLLNYDYSTTIFNMPFSSCVTVVPPNSPFSDILNSTLLSAVLISSLLAPVKRVPFGK